MPNPNRAISAPSMLQELEWASCRLHPAAKHGSIRITPRKFPFRRRSATGAIDIRWNRSLVTAPETAPTDGRSAKATGRTHQLATRVKVDFYDELKLYAAQHRLKLVEVLEQAFIALKEKNR